MIIKIILYIDLMCFKKDFPKVGGISPNKLFHDIRAHLLNYLVNRGRTGNKNYVCMCMHARHSVDTILIL